MCKVDSLIEGFSISPPGSQFEDIDDFLVQRWRGDDGRPALGYKKLTRWFNKRVLRAVYEDACRSTVTTHVDAEYELITGDESVERVELAADLEGDGLDIEELAKMLPSHGTVRKHLKVCLDAEKDVSTSPRPRGKRIESMKQAEQMAASKAGQILPSFAKADELPLAEEADVAVEIKVACPVCKTRVPVLVAIERGYICSTHSPVGNAEQ